MRRICLTGTEQAELQQLFRTATEPRLRDRIQAVLMSARGRSRKEVALDLGRSPRTVLRWLTAFEHGGLDALRIAWGTGRPPKIPEAFAEEILEWVRVGPSGCGLDRANWTYEELAEHLFRTHGLRVGTRTMGDFCRAHGVRPYRPTYRYLRGAPDQQARAKEELCVLEKKGGGR